MCFLSLHLEPIFSTSHSGFETTGIVITHTVKVESIISLNQHLFSPSMSADSSSLISSSTFTSDMSGFPMTIVAVPYSSTPFLFMSGTDDVGLSDVTHSTVVRSSQHPPTAGNPSGGDIGPIIAAVVAVVAVVVGSVIVATVVISWKVSRRGRKSSYNVRSIGDTLPGT